jgi:dihydroorotase
MLTRRSLSKHLLAGGAAVLASKSFVLGDVAMAQGVSPGGQAGNPPGGNQQNNRDLDLLIKGGNLIDPGQNINTVMDVAVRDGKIADVAADIPADRARRVVNAKGRIVTPGFIDIHGHVYDGAAGGGTWADHYCLGRGVTTVVDAGTSSQQNIEGFKRYVIDTSRCRIFALINIDSAGLANFFVHQQNPDMVLALMNPQAAAAAVKAYRPNTIGIKILIGEGIEGPRDVEGLSRAIDAGKQANVPVLAHIDTITSPLPDVLALMRKGDVYSHCYNSHKHNILDANGKVIPEAKDARERGVLFDPAHGNSHFSFDVAEKCLNQDFPPDTISTDLNNADIYQTVFDLPTTVSKFLMLGMPLDKAIACVTSKPASIFDFGVKIGRLEPGYEADISIFELRDGSFDFVDTDHKVRTGKQMLINKSVVCRGQLYINQTI